MVLSVKIGRTPKGAYSSRGHSRHLLEIAFSEPLLRTLLRTLFYCKNHSKTTSQNPSENPSPEPFPEPSQNPSWNAVLPYDPLGVHPRKVDTWRMGLRQQNPFQINKNSSLEKFPNEVKRYVLMVHVAAVRFDGAQRAMQKGKTTSLQGSNQSMF